MCADNLGGGPIWMRDCSEECFRLKPLRRMIAKTIPKVSTGRGQSWGQDRSNQPINQTNDRPIDQLTKQRKLRIIAWQIQQTIAQWSQRQLRTVVQRSQWAKQFTQANNQEPSTDQATKIGQLIPERSDFDKASNLFESGRIATNWPDDWPNNWLNTSTSTSTPVRLKVRGLDQGLEVWNRPQARSQPRRSWRFRRFKRLI